MNGNDTIALGLGLQAPWEIVSQTLDTDKAPHELRLTIQAQRGSQYPCPVCGTSCQAHDALADLMRMDTQTAKAWRIKEMLRWVIQK